MFIHWGLYAIPAGEWNGKRSLGLGEWIMNRSRVPVVEYEKLATRFNPVKFNPDEWVRLAQDAGMKYIVITSKHHDGFALFKSKASSYNVVDATPFKRDALKELADACAKRGMRSLPILTVAGLARKGRRHNTWDFGPTGARPDNKELKSYDVPARQGETAGEGTADRLRSVALICPTRRG
jgi:alpha-L-fucosidase